MAPKYPKADYARLRKLIGVSAESLAHELGVSVRTIHRWDSEEIVPKKMVLDRMADLAHKTQLVCNSRNDFDFIDLFAGIGGIRLPFQEVGGRCVFSSEWDKFSQKTYAVNFQEIPHGDITKISAMDIPPHDVLLAGFPCQAFSQAGLKQGFKDTRGTMFFEIQRILTHHKPKAFLLENVKQLRGHDKGRTLDLILKILRGENRSGVPEDVILSPEARRSFKTKLNYWVDYRVLAAKDFGVPQHRERIYIVGFDKDAFPEGTDIERLFHWPTPHKTPTRLGDILENNREVDPKYTLSDKLWEGHKRRKQEHQEKGNGFGYTLFTKQSSYANTLSARYYKDGSEILIDQSDIKKNPRKLTPRECARLQGFPEEFRVDAVSDVQAYRQFGNSVCVPVIREMAKAITGTLSSLEEASSEENKKRYA